ncbi:MAG: hypothetical protein ABJL63_14510, partial [Rhizobiaceae bacterium]
LSGLDGRDSVCDWRDDPELKRAQRDALASGKRGSALGVRQSQTLREGGFCTNLGAKALGRMPDTTGDPLLDLVAKALLQNGSS